MRKYGRRKDSSMDEGSTNFSYASSLSASQFTLGQQGEDVNASLEFLPSIQRDPPFRYNTIQPTPYRQTKTSRSKQLIQFLFLLFSTAMIFVIVFFISIGVMDRIYKDQIANSSETSDTNDDPTQTATSVLIPSKIPTSAPTLHLSGIPTIFKSSLPSQTNSLSPSLTGSALPSMTLTSLPTINDSDAPSFHPSALSSSHPSTKLTNVPSISPSVLKSSRPSPIMDSMSPTVFASSNPSKSPIIEPTSFPSTSPTLVFTNTPSSHPTISSSEHPSLGASISPTFSISTAPSFGSSESPSGSPIAVPTRTVFTIGSGVIDANTLKNELSNQPRDAEFFIHLGNFVETDGCQQSSYSDFRSALRTSKIDVPIFVLPGVNDIQVDCVGDDNPTAKPIQYWGGFFHDFNTFWDDPFTYVQRGSKSSESLSAVFSIFYNNVLFIGLNLLSEEGWNEVDYNNHLNMNLNWVRNQLQNQMVQDRGLRSLVFFGNEKFSTRNSQFFVDLTVEIEKVDIPALYLFENERVDSDFPVGKDLLFIGVERSYTPFMSVAVKTDGGQFAYQFILR